MPRLSSLVVGPGMGRDRSMQLTAKLVVYHAMKSNLPIVFDADALYMLTKEPELVRGYSRATLTPNVNELRRALVVALLPIRPRSRRERRSLRTSPGASLRPPLAFNTRPRRLSTPPVAFQLHPNVRLYGTTHVRRLCDETGVKVPGYEDDDDGDDADADRGGKGKRYAPVPGDPEAWRRKAARALADELGVTVVSKGATDEIRSVGSLDRRDRPHNVHAMGGDGRDDDHFDDVVEWCPVLTRTCDAPGMPRRCGGQGDVLAGAVATFLAWADSDPAAAETALRRLTDEGPPETGAGERSWHDDARARRSASARGDEAASPREMCDDDVGALNALCAHAACVVTRLAARRAFQEKKRSVLTTDVIPHLGGVMQTLFPV